MRVGKPIPRKHVRRTTMTKDLKQESARLRKRAAEARADADHYKQMVKEFGNLDNLIHTLESEAEQCETAADLFDKKGVTS
jgi:hypothetical protein